MFKLNEIKELIKLVDKSSLEELEIENEGSRLLLRKPPAHKDSASFPAEAAPPQLVYQTPQTASPTSQAQPSPAPAQQVESAEGQKQTEDSSLHKITSPMVGTFYESPSPEADPFVKKGDKVSKNSVVCIVEAMKLMNEIEAEVDGEIVEVMVENGQLVEYGQTLFVVKQS